MAALESEPRCFQTLAEYGRSQAFALTPARRDEVLAALPDGLTLEACVEREGWYQLAAGPVAGVVEVAGIRVEVAPKLPIRNLMFLLAYAQDSSHWRESLAWLRPDDTLYEALAEAFARQAHRCFSRGLLHGYVPRFDTSLTVRGRVRFDEQIRRRQGRMPPIEIAYEDYTVDVLENRLVKTALGVVARMPLRRRTTWDLLAHIRALLEPVSAIQVRAGYVPRVLYSRLNEAYRPAIEMARLILRLCGIEAGHGPQQVPGLLIRLNRLYQDFVTVALTEACRPLGLHVGAQDRSRTLDREGDITLVPDLTLSRQGRVVLVADAKYKRLAVTGLPNADVYQALAYAVGFEVPAAVLVYPSVEAPRATHSIASVSKLVVVRTLDLNLDPDALLEQVAALATELAFFAPAESSRSSLDIMSIPDPQWRAVAC